MSPDGKMLAIAGKGSGQPDDLGKVEIVDATTLETVRSIKVSHHDRPGVAFSPDSKKLAVGSWGTGKDKGLQSHNGYGRVEIYDVSTGGMESSFYLAHEGRVEMLAYSPDGKRLLAVTEYHAAMLFDPVSGKDVTPFLGPGFRSNWLLQAAISPDGRWLACVTKFTGGRAGLALWNLSQEKLEFYWERGAGGRTFLDVTFSPNSRLLAVVHTGIEVSGEPKRFGGVKVYHLPE